MFPRLRRTGSTGSTGVPGRFLIRPRSHHAASPTINIYENYAFQQALVIHRGTHPPKSSDPTTRQGSLGQLDKCSILVYSRRNILWEQYHVIWENPALGAMTDPLLMKTRAGIQGGFHISGETLFQKAAPVKRRVSNGDLRLPEEIYELDN